VVHDEAGHDEAGHDEVVSEMEMRDCDIAIIGGGPAGAAAAIVLARAGFRATILERERFPRFHVGESLLPFQGRVLERLGLREKVEGAGFVPKYGAVFLSSDGTCRSPIDFERTLPERYNHAFQVERSRFDELLLRHAEECGATVLEEHTVSGAELVPEQCRLRVRPPGGEELELRARWVIDASGQSSFLAKKLGLRTEQPGLRKVAHFAHFASARRHPGKREGDISIVFGDGCWFWHIPITLERVSVGCVLDHERWKATESSAEDYLTRAIESTPWLAETLSDGERATPVHTLANFSYSSRHFVGPGWMLVGDAATFLDPVFSTGVYLALRSGEEAGLRLARGLASGKPLSAGSLAGYERAMKRWTGSYFRLIRTFYDRHFPAVLFNPVEPFYRVLCQFIGGRLDPPWHHRLVIFLFYWVVRANHLFTLTPDPRPPEQALPHG